MPMNSFFRCSRSAPMLLALLLGALALGGCQTNSSPPPPPPEVEPLPQPDQTATATATEQQAAEPAVGETQASKTPPPAEQTATEPPPAAAGTTAAERAQALERELEDSYDEHDAMLREHRASAREEATAIAAQRPPGGQGPEEEDADQGELYEGAPDFGAAPPQGENDGDSGDATAATGDQTQEPGAPATSATSAAASGGQLSGATVPEDIPDGRDDDIVARQLREAAQMEKDPQLREKLWNEYRKYKNQQAAQ